MRINVDIDATAGDINRRLDPESIAIDGRDMRDRLAFVAAIADLIVFTIGTTGRRETGARWC